MLFTGVEENKYQMFQLKFCSIFAQFTFVLCQLRNVYRSKWSTASGIRKLNGEIEPCRIDCLSYDLCVADKFILGGVIIDPNNIEIDLHHVSDNFCVNLSFQMGLIYNINDI